MMFRGPRNVGVSVGSAFLAFGSRVAAVFGFLRGNRQPPAYWRTRKKLVCLLKKIRRTERELCSEEAGVMLFLANPDRHAELIEKAVCLEDAPKAWTDVEQEYLAKIAASRTEPAWIRISAIALIGHCRFARFADVLAEILESGLRDSAVAAAYALGELGRRESLLVLYRTAQRCGRNNFSDTLLRSRCIFAMYRILFPGLLPTNKKVAAWWAKSRPTGDQVQAWSRGEQLPEDDGLIPPSARQ